jgi:crotonobetainyl-CoA:carnitine CoA-transferase CaiB-like acyl-CoA transferase
MGGGGYGGGTWSPYGVFQTKEGEWVFLVPSSQKHWIELCDVLDLDLRDDDRFETLEKRRENKRLLHSKLDDIIGEYTRSEFLELFEGEEVPVAPVNDTKEAVDDPHLNDANALVRINTAEGVEKTIRVPGDPIESTGYDVEADDPPQLGEHTDEVLHSFGYSDDELQELREDGVI